MARYPDTTQAGISLSGPQLRPPGPCRGTHESTPCDLLVDSELVAHIRQAHASTPLGTYPHNVPDRLQASSDLDILLNDPKTPVRRPIRSAQTPPASPLLSSDTANVGRHRPGRGSMLLCSPARPGNSTRIKRIFGETEGVRITPYDGGVLLYSQLPNIPSSPVKKPENQPCEMVPPGEVGAQHGLILPLPEALLAPPDVQSVCESPARSSQHSTGSWTNDLGYINLEIPSKPSTESPRYAILDWLATVSDTHEQSQAHDVQDVQEGPDIVRRKSLKTRRFQSSKGSSEVSVLSTATNRPSATLFPRAQRHISDTCNRLYLDQFDLSQDSEDGGVQLSPFGHRNSPTKSAAHSAAFSRRRVQRKENVARETETMYSKRPLKTSPRVPPNGLKSTSVLLSKPARPNSNVTGIAPSTITDVQVKDGSVYNNWSLKSSSFPEVNGLDDTSVLSSKSLRKFKKNLANGT